MVQTLNVPTLPEPSGYTHVGIATGSRLVFLAGQVAQDAAGELVGAGDLAAQTEQAVVNVAACLDAAGATFADVAKTTLYVVDWDESKLEQLMAGFGRAAQRLGRGAPRPDHARLGPGHLPPRVPDRDRLDRGAAVGAARLATAPPRSGRRATAARP